MNKEKVYCPICHKELIFDDKEGSYIFTCHCYDEKRFKYLLAYCSKCKKFTARRGTRKINKCNRCAVILQHKVMLEQDPEGYLERQANAVKKANEKMKAQGKGVWSKEQHIKAEATKRRNGTDLGNKNFREKIGCNGNPIEIIQKQKELGIGIFRTNIRNNHKPGNCTKCGNYCKHRNAFGIGMECGCLAKLGTIFQPNFITKDNVRFYKGLPVEELSEKILSRELDISDYPGFNIRFGRVFYKTEDIITGEIKLLNNSNFVEEKNVLYFLDKSTNSYVSWSDYKSRFKTKNIDWKLPEGFMLIPTFREQDSSSWEGARGAFEQSLVDLNIRWFVYIKFYISADNQVLPLVIGKSGSLLVNSSGSDLSFSTDTDDGPARCFLADEDLDWCKTQIAILKCDDEITAYEQECRLAADYNLFES